MNLTGLLVGLSTFPIIGLFHPLVIKEEYYGSRKDLDIRNNSLNHKTDEISRTDSYKI